MLNNFKGYKLIFDPRATRDLKKLDHSISQMIVEKLEDLVEGKQNLDVIKLKGSYKQDHYRLVCGKYRAIFEVHEHVITINVVEVGHRKEIYRRY